MTSDPNGREIYVKLLRGDDDPYYADFGRFVVAYSGGEAALRYLLRHLLGEMPQEEFAALFHRFQVVDIITAINRLLAARGKTALAADLKSPFAQLRAIGEVRNALVHWGAVVSEEVFVVDNSHRAHTVQSRQEYRVSRDQLADMELDLLKIQMHFGVATDEIRPEIRSRVVDPILASAWRYTPPPQGPPDTDTARPPPQ